MEIIPLNMRPFNLVIKRFLDVLVCSLILILGMPIFLIISMVVRLSSSGPIFFIQDRVGKDEKVYRMIKFRTMTGEPDPAEKCWTAKEEARITRFGHFLRDYGLDELPQLINIFKGDMSIVGPRSPLPAQVEAFSPHLKKMFKMRPGVLSLAAIMGRRSLTMEERYKLHVQYVETWSLMLDLKILWRGLFIVLGRESAKEILPKD